MVRIVVQELWMVIRTDEAGNTFLMREGISKELAEAIVEMYTERGHKQHYTMHSYTPKSKQAVLEQHNISSY